MNDMKTQFIRVTLLSMLLCVQAQTGWSQVKPGSNEAIITLMEKIFSEIPDDLTEIDPKIKRVAMYRLNMDKAYMPTVLQAHFESRLIEIFRTIDPPKMVSLPKLSTLRVSSTDSSFSIINSLPSPDELWRVGRSLRVDAFIEGDVTYVPRKALFLDLRLSRTGTNEVLWAKSYKAYEEMAVPQINPVKESLNAGFEFFQIHTNSVPDSLLHQDFNNKLVQYTIYLGLYQFMTAASRLRYELRGGISFLSEGVTFTSPQFQENAFYGLKEGASAAANPISLNFRIMMHSSLVRNRENPAGDWLSAYVAVTRYFTRNMPDVTGIGVGLRTDISPNFSLSTGFSMILGKEFDSQPLNASGEPIRLKVDGLHFEVLLLQYTF